MCTQIELSSLLEYEQPSKYIVESTDYNASYQTPVLTAGKTFILGYTNEQDGIYSNLPVIIFDDFTTASKYVNFPFKVKSSAMKILKPNLDLVDPKYIYYRMQVINIDHSTHKRYWIQQYSKIKISIPTLAEQKRIVARIEELFSNLDSAVETLQKTKQQLEVYRQAVLREAFLPFSDKIPLKDIMECKLGKMLDKNKNKGIERQYIRNANVRWFGFDLNDLLLMRISDEEVERYSVIKGDLIICEGGEPGRCAIWNYDEPMFYQKALHRVRFVGKHNAKFYMYYFYYLAKCGQLKQYFTGSGIKHLTKDSLSKVTVPIAEKENQDNVVNEIESKLSVCENIEKTVDEALQQAEAMRQSILKQAFEGE